MQGLESEYAASANNLANVSTVGYKRRMTAFSSLLAERLAGNPAAEVSSEYLHQAAGGANLPADQRPADAVFSRVAIDFSQGPLRQTGRKLDLAIEGEGFFVVETPSGPAYTRCGTLRTNANRQLVDTAGRLIAGRNGPIVLPEQASADSVEIRSDGTVLADGREVDRLRLVRFQDTSKLTPAGENCFVAPAQLARADDTESRVHQGFVEGSNVQSTEALTGLITVSRLYEANMRSVRAQDDRIKNLIQLAMS
jgi:flagellar basal-body rod protein FlgF